MSEHLNEAERPKSGDLVVSVGFAVGVYKGLAMPNCQAATDFDREKVEDFKRLLLAHSTELPGKLTRVQKEAEPEHSTKVMFMWGGDRKTDWVPMATVPAVGDFINGMTYKVIERRWENVNGENRCYLLLAATSAGFEQHWKVPSV